VTGGSVCRCMICSVTGRRWRTTESRSGYTEER